MRELVGACDPDALDVDELVPPGERAWVGVNSWLGVGDALGVWVAERVAACVVLAAWVCEGVALAEGDAAWLDVEETDAVASWLPDDVELRVPS